MPNRAKLKRYNHCVQFINMCFCSTFKAFSYALEILKNRVAIHNPKVSQHINSSLLLSLLSGLTYHLTHTPLSLRQLNSLLPNSQYNYKQLRPPFPTTKFKGRPFVRGTRMHCGLLLNVTSCVRFSLSPGSYDRLVTAGDGCVRVFQDRAEVREPREGL